jgi:Ca2+-dependent lipid-binding protein
LPQSDAFFKPSAYAVVEWRDDEKGQTAVIENNLHPLYHDEAFTLRLPFGSLADQRLVISMWSKTPQTSREFLGCVVLEGASSIRHRKIRL